MKNQITSSHFRRQNVMTEIVNPSPRVMALMSGISIEPPYESIMGGMWQFYHKDIGTMENMETLFKSLDECP